jgi:hypothetical protein
MRARGSASSSRKAVVAMKKLLLIAGLVAVAGCARVQIPAEQFDAPESIMQSARAAGADAVPEARMHLDLAREQTEVARELADRGDPRARLVLARAQVDAEMALALARESKATGEAREAAHELKNISRGAR